MTRCGLMTLSRKVPVWKLFCAGIALLAGTLAVFADTPGMIRSVTAGGCYCECDESHVRAGCAKMCDRKKYATRWWAKTCAKPHMQTPTDNSNAGPRFPHPNRAEHAQL